MPPEPAKAPRVSIIIPTYNQGRFLGAALESVLAQTVQDWEAIIINNYSDDETVEVVKSFNEGRFTLIDFANHGIIAASRNKGVSLARAEWIAFLDSDDTWLPEKLERCLAVATPDVDFVGHAMNLLRDGKYQGVQFSGPEARAEYRSLLFVGTCATPSATLMRKSMYEKVGGSSENPEFRTAEDYELLLKIAAAGARVAFIPDRLTDYLLHDANTSGSAKKHLDAGVAIVRNHYATLEKRPFDGLRLRRRLAMLYYGAARKFMDLGDKPQALKYFFKCIFNFPFILRSYMAIVMTVFKVPRKA